MPPVPAAPSPDSAFDVVRKGYDQGQVEQHLRRLDAEMRILAHDRDAAVDQSGQLARELDEARARSERLRAQVRSLVSPPQSIQGMSERMRSMLRMAEDEVADMLAGAEAEAERRIHEADRRAAEALFHAREQADAIRAEASRLAEQAAHEQARAAAQAEAARALVAEDFTLAMDQRRAEALAELTAEREALRRDVGEQRARAVQEARDIVEAAREKARTMIAAAEAELTGLTALRTRIAGQLDHARSALQRTVAGLGMLPEESWGAAEVPPAEVPQAGVRPQAGSSIAAAETAPQPVQPARDEAADRPAGSTPDLDEATRPSSESPIAPAAESAPQPVDAPAAQTVHETSARPADAPPAPTVQESAPRPAGDVPARPATKTGAEAVEEAAVVAQPT
ncbi:MAG TPA: hypothetical protein VEZ42_12050, partial [Pseudonocardia sp.]|nr:hypothetical protein [Pseudonocardia sp.]